MEFIINNMTYNIVEKTQKELCERYKKDFHNSNGEIVFGYTSYIEHEISLNENINEEEKIRTLKHELVHCWLHNTGHSYSTYEEEDVCEIVACINNFINDIVEKYIKYKKHYKEIK